jgi:hypothetical protein
MSDHPPYTYASALIDEGRTSVALSIYTPHLDVRCLGIKEGDRPSLSLSTPEARVSISTTGAGPVTTGDVDLARKIFAAAARYLAECERLHAAIPAPVLPGLEHAGT